MAFIIRFPRCRSQTRIVVIAIFTVVCYLLFTSPSSHSDEQIEKIIKEIEKSQSIKDVSYRSSLRGKPNSEGNGFNGISDPSPHTSNYLAKLWRWANDVSNHKELFPDSHYVDLVTEALANAKITSVDVVSLGEYESGTSMKWLATLEGGQKTVMKILWEEKGTMKQDGLCNYGFEMPTSEIASFHLHNVLGFRNTPYVSGRRVNLLTEILPHASERVKEQIVRKDNNTCVVGTCYLCEEAAFLCPDSGIIEVSVAYWVNLPLRLHTYPPSYMPFSTPNIAKFEKLGMNNDSYCQAVRKTVHPYELNQFYYDLIDFAIIDTLMYHYDSKHYEVIDDIHARGLRVRLDHGRGLRNSTYQNLLVFKSSKLSDAFHKSLNKDAISPVLVDDWFPAIDRRYNIIMDTVKLCATAKGGLNKVLV